MAEPLRPGFRRHRFMEQSIDLPEDLTEAQLDGRACVRCGDERSVKRPVEAWNEQSAQLFECVDADACAERVADAELEARATAEEATANALFEEDRREAEREQHRILSLDALEEGKEAPLDMSEEDV